MDGVTVDLVRGLFVGERRVLAQELQRARAVPLERVHPGVDHQPGARADRCRDSSPGGRSGRGALSAVPGPKKRWLSASTSGKIDDILSNRGAGILAAWEM